MKKITAILGSSHNDFDRQLKDTLNDISEAIAEIIENQKKISEHQYNISLAQASKLEYPICETCQHSAHFTTINVLDGTHKSFCNKCIVS